jgi:hypothetical protein
MVRAQQQTRVSSTRSVKVRAFRQKFTNEDAIGSQACSIGANMRVTNVIPLGRPLFLPVYTVNCVRTLKVDAAVEPQSRAFALRAKAEKKEKMPIVVSARREGKMKPAAAVGQSAGTVLSLRL